MAKKIPRWVVVCCVVCGIAIFAAVGLVVGGVLVLRDAVQGFEKADQTMETVVATYGPAEAFSPAAAGAIAADRMDAFLAVRENMAPAREGLGRSLSRLSGSGGTLGKLLAGAYLLHRLADFVDERHGGLLEAEMGLGEYYYLYSLAYFSWLGKQPEDGPTFKLVGEDGYVLETVEGIDASGVHDYRLEQVRGSLNRLLLPVLRNQQADLAAGTHDREWAEILAAEIAAMEANPRRLPWEAGLPQVIASSFDPYRDRLEDSYCPMCNALEVGLARR